MVRRNFLLIFAIAFVIRLGLFLVVYNQPAKFYSNSDARDYEDIARNLQRYGVFSNAKQPPLTPNVYRPPLYPSFIAGIYAAANSSPAMVILSQVLLGSLTAALMTVLANSLNLSNRVGWIAGLIVAIDPLIVLTTYQMLTETLFLFLLISTCIMIALYFKTRNLYWLAGSAILLALTSLTRAIVEFLPFALLPLFLIVYKKGKSIQFAKSVLLFLVLSLSATFSWAFRNYYEANQWTLSAAPAYNILYYRARNVIAKEENISKDEALLELERYIQTAVDQQHLTEAQKNSLIQQKALEIFRQYPVTTIQVHAEGFFKVLANPGLDLMCIMLDDKNMQFDSNNNMVGCSTSEIDSSIPQTIENIKQMSWFERVVAAWEVVLLVSMYLGAVWGGWKLLRDKQRYLFYFLFIEIAYFSILSAGGESVPRFRIPIIPFLAILTGIALSKSYLSSGGNSNE